MRFGAKANFSMNQLLETNVIGVEIILIIIFYQTSFQSASVNSKIDTYVRQ